MTVKGLKVLFKKHPSGQPHPVAYTSQALSAAEKISELETLAVVGNTALSCVHSRGHSPH